MPRPKKQQTITDIFEQFTAQLGALVKEKVSLAVVEATETFFKGECKKAPPVKAKAKPEADAAPKTRKRRRRKAAKKAAATTPAPEQKPAE